MIKYVRIDKTAKGGIFTEIIKEADFKKEIKSTPRPVYLFFGDEDYLKSFSLKLARDTLCPDPSFAFFNDIRLDAVGFESAALVDALMPMPMMEERKIVTLTGLNFNTMRQGELEELCTAMEALDEYDYNTLIVVAAADCLNPGILPKRPSQTLTKLAEHLTPVQFERCGTQKLAAWVQKHFAHNGVAADSAFCQAFPEYCGHSMYVLAGEIDKLSYYVLSHGRTTVTEKEMRLVCTPAAEYDAFAFTNAIMEGKSEMALAILADYRFRRVDPLIILGDVSRVICDMLAVKEMCDEGLTNAQISSVLKLHEFKVGLYRKSIAASSPTRLFRALDACLDADKALKLSQTGYAPLEQLICAL